MSSRKGLLISWPRVRLVRLETIDGFWRCKLLRSLTCGFHGYRALSLLILLLAYSSPSSLGLQPISLDVLPFHDASAASDSSVRGVKLLFFPTSLRLYFLSHSDRLHLADLYHIALYDHAKPSHHHKARASLRRQNQACISCNSLLRFCFKSSMSRSGRPGVRSVPLGYTLELFARLRAQDQSTELRSKGNFRNHPVHSRMEPRSNRIPIPFGPESIPPESTTSVSLVSFRPSEGRR